MKSHEGITVYADRQHTARTIGMSIHLTVFTWILQWQQFYLRLWTTMDLDIYMYSNTHRALSMDFLQFEKKKKQQCYLTLRYFIFMLLFPYSVQLMYRYEFFEILNEKIVRQKANTHVYLMVKHIFVFLCLLTASYRDLKHRNRRTCLNTCYIKIQINIADRCRWNRLEVWN